MTINLEIGRNYQIQLPQGEIVTGEYQCKMGAVDIFAYEERFILMNPNEVVQEDGVLKYSADSNLQMRILTTSELVTRFGNRIKLEVVAAQ